MTQYTVSSTNSHHFCLALDKRILGELNYKKWYSFNADIVLANNRKYNLESKGFWDTTIELHDGLKTLLSFRMGWEGIIIETFFGEEEQVFLLKLKGLFSNKFVLLNQDNEELMVAETIFNWRKLNFNYNIETPQNFDDSDKNSLLLLTVVHCINYYITIITAATA
ncbi:MAG: hypothetical protein KF829_01740 [Ferruginibacter sp.]|nr:hypothetical protein [Ferruginibacter sp.]